MSDMNNTKVMNYSDNEDIEESTIDIEESTIDIGESTTYADDLLTDMIESTIEEMFKNAEASGDIDEKKYNSYNSTKYDYNNICRSQLLSQDILPEITSFDKVESYEKIRELIENGDMKSISCETRPPLTNCNIL